MPRRTAFDPLPGDEDFVEQEAGNNNFIFQKNEGKYEFTLQEVDISTMNNNSDISTTSGKKRFSRAVVLDLKLPRFLDTSLLQVDVRPTLIRVLIKGRLLQLRLPSEVYCDLATSQRSAVTGHLVVTMPCCEDSVKERLQDKFIQLNIGEDTQSAEEVPGNRKEMENKDKAKTNNDSNDNTHNTPVSCSVGHQSERKQVLINHCSDDDSDDDEVPPIMNS